MNRKTMAAVVLALAALAINRAAEAGSDRPSLTGRWTLNRQLSQFPSDLGFGMDLLGGSGSDSAGGGRGGASGGGGILAATFQESQEDARRREMLVEEARNPSPHLTIAQTDSVVTITDERGRSRTFHPNGKEEVQALAQELPVTTTTRWDGTRLEIRYKVERYRELRYTYSRTVDPPQLVVQIRFVERGGHDAVTRVYEPTRANEPALPDRATAPAEASRTSAVPTGTPPAPAGAAAGSDAGRAAVPPASGRGTAPVVIAGPDAELKGLMQIGVVVEDLSSQAAACGLTLAPIEAVVSKSLSDAGFKVLRNSDDDTYVYVNINTSSVSSGLCVSRYDAFLYTYTTATLPYQTTPVLAQVMLLHKSGIAAGAPAAQAETVMRSVKQYADEFARRIRDANQR